MKTWKKNMIAGAVLVAVCAGIYVNWLYTEEQSAANLTDTLDADKIMSSDVLTVIILIRCWITATQLFLTISQQFACPGKIGRAHV